MFDDALHAKAEAVLDAYRRRGWMLATAESCTGGLIAGCLTEIAGSSDVVERGFVTYSNQAKTDLLGVPPGNITSHGAVSGEVAEAMASGAIAHSPAHVAVSVTGVAGPGGGTPAKPVGHVVFGLATRHGGQKHIVHQLDGNRSAIRRQSVAVALDLLLEAAE